MGRDTDIHKQTLRTVPSQGGGHSRVSSVGMPSQTAILLLFGISWGTHVQPSVAIRDLCFSGTLKSAQQGFSQWPVMARKRPCASVCQDVACHRRTNALCSLHCKQMQDLSGDDAVPERFRKETDGKGKGLGFESGRRGQAMQRACLWIGAKYPYWSRAGRRRTAAAIAIGKIWRAASMLVAIMMLSSPLLRTGNLQIHAFSPSPGIEAPAERRVSRTSSPLFIPDPSREEVMAQRWRYSEFFEAVKRRKIDRVVFSSDLKKLVAFDLKGERHLLQAVPKDQELLPMLVKCNVDVQVLPPASEDEGDRGAALFAVTLVSAVLLFRLSVSSGGESASTSISSSGAKIRVQSIGDVTFADVMGVDGAKLELEEVVQFLNEPDRFTDLGAVIPRGVILEGPPGTGKTLLARAVAGESKVPFFSISGSEFVEMFVGVGAARVRDLFAQAKARAPSIVFIDEIDAVGRQRGAGVAGGNDEREQTLNQILTEMDGFEGNSGVIVIAATNRADVLDPALLRPGRFDRRVVVDLPDFDGRIAILGVHSKDKPLDGDVDLAGVSRRTTGFSGAALSNLMNEAAIFAARQNRTTISAENVADALDRILMGPEKKGGGGVSRRIRELVAYHEAGHALVGALLPDFDQVVKATIVPRGGAGGLTIFAPDEQRSLGGLYTRQYLEAQMCVAMGGRVAEEIVFGDGEVTTGASNDLQQVTRTARAMVTQYGMSHKIGPVTVREDSPGNPFLGREMGSPRSSVSAHVRNMVDEEVSRLVLTAHSRAKQILSDNRRVLDIIAKRLVEKESVSADELQEIVGEGDCKMGDYM